MTPALKHLNRLANEAKAKKYANVPQFALVKSRYSDKSANDLTTAIIDYLKYSGYFATRLASTGTFRADLQKFIPSKQRSGLPDIMGVINGLSVFIEVKFGKDRLSLEQQDAISELKKAGAFCVVVSNFQEFYDWFQEEFPSQLA
ncbi:hypothetical protein GCM10028805_27240 [Spirosoma harenae]